jgi:hypothetical protein
MISHIEWKTINKLNKKKGFMSVKYKAFILVLLY